MPIEIQDTLPVFLANENPTILPAEVDDRMLGGLKNRIFSVTRMTKAWKENLLDYTER